MSRPEPEIQSRPTSRLRLLLILGLSLGVAAIGAWYGLRQVGQNMLRESPVYQMSLEKALSSEALQRSLGHPIQPTGTVQGLLQSPQTGGRAVLQIPLAGSRESGLLQVRGQEMGGTWRIQQMWLQREGKPELVLINELN